MREPRNKLDFGDAGAVVAWLETLGQYLSDLRALEGDATAPKRERVHSRAYLKRKLTKAHRELRLHMADAMPPEPGTVTP